MVKIEGFELFSPQLVALPLPAATTIRVTAGRLWLTCQGRPDDIWLRASERWTADQDCLVWISAEPLAEFQIARPAGPGHRALESLDTLVRALGWRAVAPGPA